MPRRLRLSFAETEERKIDRILREIRKNKRKNKVKVEEKKKEEKKDAVAYRYEPPLTLISGVPIPEEEIRKLRREVMLASSVPENPVAPKPIEYSPRRVYYHRTPPTYQKKIHAYSRKPRRRK